MSETKTDISFSSKAFPLAEEVAEWDVLSPAEQRAFIEASEEAGFQSGVAPDETLEERLARVRSAAF